MTRNSVARKYNGEYVNIQKEVQVVDVKRNPYLVDYQQHRKEPKRNLPTEAETSRKNASKNQSVVHISRRAKKRAQRRRKLFIRRAIFLLVCIFMLCSIISFSVTLIVKGVNAIRSGNINENQIFSRGNARIGIEMDETELIQGLPLNDYVKHPTWTEDFLTPNEYSRPGEVLEEVNSVFVHYTANPGTSAAQNRSYFEQQKDTHERSVSAHFIIGYEGEIIQCIPLDEIAYAVQTRNYDSISIECCYLEDDGSFTQETYDSLIKLLQWLVEVYDLDVDEDILRHYDCGGKKCPIYYTNHEDEWDRLKEDVKS